MDRFARGWGVVVVEAEETGEEEQEVAGCWQTVVKTVLHARARFRRMRCSGVRARARALNEARWWFSNTCECVDKLWRSPVRSPSFLCE